MSALNKDQLAYILKSGLQAPSADNNHQLVFEVNQHGINVRYTGGELPKTGSYKRILVLLSIAAVSENLKIAASRFGIAAEPVLFPDTQRPDLVVLLSWRRDAVETDRLWMSISKRHTNRRLVFHGPPLSLQEQTSLSDQAASLSGCRLSWFDEPHLKQEFLKLLRWAEAERFHNPLLHRELFSSIRFDVGWNSSCEEGLPPGALGVERPLRPVFSALTHWPLMRILNHLGAYHVLGWRAAYLPCRLAPHLGIISTPDADDISVFTAGRAFQRLWLTATDLNLALQPLPASALYSLEGARLEGIPANVQERLIKGWSRLLPGQFPLMPFRLGRAVQLPVAASRKPLASYYDGNT